MERLTVSLDVAETERNLRSSVSGFVFPDGSSSTLSGGFGQLPKPGDEVHKNGFWGYGPYDYTGPGNSMDNSKQTIIRKKDPEVIAYRHDKDVASAVKIKNFDNRMKELKRADDKYLKNMDKYFENEKRGNLRKDGHRADARKYGSKVIGTPVSKVYYKYFL